MSTLSEFIKRRPGKTWGEWAKTFGVSRTYLYGLTDGSRNPSIAVAVRIAEETDGLVPVSAWPNLSAVISAAQASAPAAAVDQEGAA